MVTEQEEIIHMVEFGTPPSVLTRNAVSVKVFNLRILAKNYIVRRPAGGFDYVSGN